MPLETCIRMLGCQKLIKKHTLVLSGRMAACWKRTSAFLGQNSEIWLCWSYFLRHFSFHVFFYSRWNCAVTLVVSCVLFRDARLQANVSSRRWCLMTLGHPLTSTERTEVSRPYPDGIYHVYLQGCRVNLHSPVLISPDATLLPHCS